MIVLAEGQDGRGRTWTLRRLANASVWLVYVGDIEAGAWQEEDIARAYFKYKTTV